jgi:hypothetical protein
MNFFIGLGLLLVGFLLIAKSEWFFRNFGRIDWAESHLGTEGGTRLFYKFLGILIIILGFTVMFGMWGGLMEATFGRLYRR